MSAPLLTEFEVKCDETNNPPESILQGLLNVYVHLNGDMATLYLKHLLEQHKQHGPITS